MLTVEAMCVGRAGGEPLELHISLAQHRWQLARLICIDSEGQGSDTPGIIIDRFTPFANRVLTVTADLLDSEMRGADSGATERDKTH